MLRRFVPLVAAIAIAAGGCGLTIPTDPRGTLEDVRGGELEVGVSVNEPWTSWDAGAEEPTGTEVDLVRAFADHLDAELSWVRGGEEELVRELSEERLHLVIGGLTSTTPWADRAAITAIYTRSTAPDGTELGHVMAAVMGENAFLVELEHVLRAQDVGP